MPSISVRRNTLPDLVSDLRKIPIRARHDMKATVRQAAIVGNTVAKDLARVSAGKHGKLYHKAFTWETGSYVGFGGADYTGTYGPDASRPQGGMEFENGSRHQRPHRDLARSASLIGPTFAMEVGRLPARWFWPR